MRRIVASYMLKHSEEQINGLPLSVAVTGEFPSLKDFVENVVLKDNEQASLLVLVIAPTVLRIQVDVALFDSQAQVTILI